MSFWDKFFKSDKAVDLQKGTVDVEKAHADTENADVLRATFKQRRGSACNNRVVPHWQIKAQRVAAEQARRITRAA